MTFLSLFNVCLQSEFFKHWNTWKSGGVRPIKYSRCWSSSNLHSWMASQQWMCVLALVMMSSTFYVTVPGVFLWQLQEVSWLTQHDRHLSQCFFMPSSQLLRTTSLSQYTEAITFPTEAFLQIWPVSVRWHSSTVSSTTWSWSWNDESKNPWQLILRETWQNLPCTHRNEKFSGGLACF